MMQGDGHVADVVAILTLRLQNPHVGPNEEDATLCLLRSTYTL